MKHNKLNDRGFTLVEILIVVIILGILAAIVIPQFTNATSSSKISALQSTLQNLRTQIDVYKVQHSDTPPPLTSFWNLMTTWTDTTGNTTGTANSTSFPNGPYFSVSAVNPLNGNSGISSSASSTGDGWYYNATGQGYMIYARDTTGNSITTY